eukprot:CAMPEP_0202050576 /NCGR_PEP_ID=MMETSP0963-20130614/4094_1 /ASSEMBLY_ACC=CAM_ASM_000494 /TAXON_ID=4773 /ORGANISM="Schizochytrium aggregatum, Strain ATCC28209" /LENGTH=76 /DNA_ID=CAMNT_0048615677 /DNA_START=81 /DNA_END=308 /DNA_ORIENTATION=+
MASCDVAGPEKQAPVPALTVSLGLLGRMAAQELQHSCRRTLQGNAGSRSASGAGGKAFYASDSLARTPGYCTWPRT